MYKTKWIKIDGIRIRYVDFGKGDVILFLHGLGGRIESDNACFPYLKNSFRIIAFDQPGSGYSDKPDREYNLEYLVDFVFKFADKLKLNKFYLCGGSQGGLLALLCSYKNPNRIIKTAIYSPSGVWGAHPLFSNFIKRLPPITGRYLLHITSYCWYSKYFDERKKYRNDALIFIDTREMPEFGEHILGCLVSVFNTDRRPIFSKIKTPTLILWGINDFGQPISQGRNLVKLLQNAKLIEVPKTGHNLSTERPAYFASEVKEFFQN